MIKDLFIYGCLKPEFQFGNCRIRGTYSQIGTALVGEEAETLLEQGRRGLLP